jgi:hypothetical protein
MKEGRGAFALTELLLVTAMFSGFLLVSYLLLSSGMASWQRTANVQDVAFQLARARVALSEDLRQSSMASLAVSQLPNPGAGQTEGNVLWLLSALDPTSGEMARDEDGKPLWQRNILYYSTVPTDHDQLFGQSCQGQDGRCPHKFLVRRVFDTGTVTTPSSPRGKMEKLMTPGEVKTRAQAPGGWELKITGPAAESQQLVASGLVDFQVRLAPAGSPWEDEVEVHLSGFDLQLAGQTLAGLGSQDLRNSPYTRHAVFAVYPGN